MDIEQRDQIETHLEDARSALDKAVQTLAVGFTAKPVMTQNDWAIYGYVVSAAHTLTVAINSLPSLHSLRADAARANCLRCANPQGPGTHSPDCPVGQTL